MKRVEIELEVLTPMFSYGDRKVVEFRITELKSLMRSIFREIYYFENLDDMRNKEGYLFGTTSNIDKSFKKESSIKSPVSFVIKDNIKRENIYEECILPHKKDKINPIKCIKGSTKVWLNMICKKNIDVEIYIKLLLQVSIMGAIGRRSRKGFGSFKINEIKIDGKNEYQDTLKKNPIDILKDTYKNGEYSMRKIEISELEVKFQEVNNELNYPYIKKLILINIKNDRDYLQLISNISQLTHDRVHEYNDFTEKIDNKEKINKNVLGNCNKQLKRFASPICVSFWENDDNKYMIIKELNYNYIYNKLNIRGENEQQANKDYVNKYVEELIKIGKGKK